MRTATSHLSDVLWPAARRAILGLLYVRPGREIHLREIARRSGLAPATIHREVVALTEAGILTRRTSGHQTYYAANPECPIHDELRGIVLKTVGLADVIREALEPFADRIDCAFVYGSVADGAADATSDVDLFVVGRVTLRDLSGTMPILQEALERELNIVTMTAEEFLRLRAGGDHFVSTVMGRPRLDVIGSTHGS